MLRPQPGGSLKFATATYRSPYGTVRSAWKKRGKQLRYDITIPANTTATVVLPVKNLGRVKLDGKPLASHEVAVQGDNRFALPAGEYSIAW